MGQKYSKCPQGKVCVFHTSCSFITAKNKIKFNLFSSNYQFSSPTSSHLLIMTIILVCNIQLVRNQYLPVLTLSKKIVLRPSRRNHFICNNVFKSPFLICIQVQKSYKTEDNWKVFLDFVSPSPVSRIQFKVLEFLLNLNCRTITDMSVQKRLYKK